MARKILKDANLANGYWKEVEHIDVYILNRVQIRVNHTKTPYELLNGIPPTMKFFRIFKINSTSKEMRMILESLIPE